MSDLQARMDEFLRLYNGMPDDGDVDPTQAAQLLVVKITGDDFDLQFDFETLHSKQEARNFRSVWLEAFDEAAAQLPD